MSSRPRPRSSWTFSSPLLALGRERLSKIERPAGERHEQYEVHDHRPVGEQHPLRRTTGTSLVNQEQVAKNSVDHERNRELQPIGAHVLDRVSGNGVQPVGKHARGRHHGNHLVEQRNGVIVQISPVRHRLGMERGELMPALGEPEKYREEQSAKVQPVRHRNGNRDPATQHAEHESHRNRHHVDDHLFLQNQRVEDLQAEIGGGHRGEGGTDGVGERGAGGPAEDHSAGNGASGKQPGGDGPVPLFRVPPILLAVEPIIEEIHAAGEQAEGDHRERRPERGVSSKDALREEQGGEDDQILRPLPRAKRGEQGQPTRGGRRRNRSGCAWQRFRGALPGRSHKPRPIPKYTNPFSRRVSGLKTLRPSKITGDFIIVFIRSRSGCRNSFHSVTRKRASAPGNASYGVATSLILSPKYLLAFRSETGSWQETVPPLASSPSITSSEGASRMSSVFGLNEAPQTANERPARLPKCFSALRTSDRFCRSLVRSTARRRSNSIPSSRAVAISALTSL